MENKMDEMEEANQVNNLTMVEQSTLNPLYINNNDIEKKKRVLKRMMKKKK